MEFSSQIKTKRQKLGLSQGQVANHLYVSRKSVSQWENGDSYPDIATLVKLSEYLHISLDPLIKEDKHLKQNLKKRGVNKSVSWSLYLSLTLSFIMVFISLAGLSFSTNSTVRRIFFVLIILSILNEIVMAPINTLKEKYHAKSKGEVSLVDSGILWLILGIVFLLASIPTSFFKAEIGGSFLGAGFLFTILGIYVLVSRKKKAKKRNAK